MKVTVTSSARFGITKEGKYVTTSPVVAYGFWVRYLEVFDEVQLVARCHQLDVVPEGALDVTGPGVVVAELPTSNGASEMILKAPAFIAGLRRILAQDNALILRIPCPLGNLALRLRPTKQPYCIEVIGDTWDSLSPQGFDSMFRVPLRYMFTWFQKLVCRHATAASYVTEYSLQQRYPHTNAKYTTHYSSIELSDQFMSQTADLSGFKDGKIRLTLVGTLDRLYKSPDTMLESVAQLVRQGFDVSLNLVGGGRLMGSMQELSEKLGTQDVVTFHGHVSSREELIQILLATDIFVLPSRQEGLPRAMIEAMAVGLPCIGGTVGGFPELIAADCLVEPNDVDLLTKTVANLIENPEYCLKLARDNKEKAKNYLPEHIEARRNEFYRYCKTLFEK